MKKYGLLICIVVFCMALMTGCSKRIKLQDYVKIEIDGADHHARASAHMDDEGLLAASGVIEGESGDGEYDEDDFAGLVDFLKYDEALSELDVKVEPNENISNGDKLKITVEYPERLEEVLGCKFNMKSGDSFEVKVKDLPEAIEIDAFKDLTLSCDGIAPNAYVTSPESKEIDGCTVNYQYEPASGLSAGDTVTVTASLSDEDNYCLKEEKKDFKAGTLDSYIMKFADISEDTLTKMKQQAEDAWNARVAEKWDPEEEQCRSFTYKGAYFLTPKSPDTDNNYIGEPTVNQCYLVYEVAAHDTAGDFTYYYYYKFENIRQLADGTQSVDLSEYDYPDDGLFSSEAFDHGDHGYAGYENLDSLFAKQVTAQIDAWKYESTIQ